jgi:xylitol oxidase
MSSSRTNWAGNHHIAGGRVHEPRSIDELRDLVIGQRHLRVLGTGHTFNALPDSRGDLVSLATMPKRFEVDPDGTITVGGATRYADLSEPTDRAGFALEAMASLPHISVAGACATGTHGSGDRTRSLAAAVSGIELMTAAGEIVQVRRRQDGAQLPGLIVSLGAVGVVTSVTLDVVPRYDVRQVVYEDAPADRILDRFDAVTSAASSVSLFTVWDERRFHQVWCKQRSDQPHDPSAVGRLLGARRADGPRHPIPGHDAAACTPQSDVPGAWFERLPHFRSDRTPSSGNELQSEYLVDRDHGPAALAALFKIGTRIVPALMVSEVRTVAADDLWLSPSFGRASVAVHFTWHPDPVAVRDAVALVEEALAPFDPRPHWGKVWDMPIGSVRASYPRLADFADLRDRWDPERRFSNDFVQAVLGD